MNEKEERLTISAAAEYYGRSESWIRKKILSGDLEANKESFKYGKRWETTKAALDDLEKRLQEQAKIENEVVQVREKNKAIEATELIQNLLKESKKQNKELLEDTAKKIIENQQKTIDKLEKRLDRIEKRQNLSFIDRIKGWFSK